MTDVEEIENEIAENDIELIDYRFKNPGVGAMTLADEAGRYIIAVDERRCRGEADKKTKLYHELGHCLSGALYSVYSPLRLKNRCEYRADKYIASNKITKEKIEAYASAAEYSELWELAEHFNVTTEYMNKIMKIHFGER